MLGPFMGWASRGPSNPKYATRTKTPAEHNPWCSPAAAAAGDTSSTSVAHAGCDAVDGDQQRLTQPRVLGVGPSAPQHLHLRTTTHNTACSSNSASTQQCRRASTQRPLPPGTSPTYAGCAAHLQDVDGVDVGVAHLNQAPQRRVGLQQPVVARHLRKGKGLQAGQQQRPHVNNKGTPAMYIGEHQPPTEWPPLPRTLPNQPTVSPPPPSSAAIHTPLCARQRPPLPRLTSQMARTVSANFCRSSLPSFLPAGSLTRTSS